MARVKSDFGLVSDFGEDDPVYLCNRLSVGFIGGPLVGVPKRRPRLGHWLLGVVNPPRWEAPAVGRCSLLQGKPRWALVGSTQF